MTCVVRDAAEWTSEIRRRAAAGFELLASKTVVADDSIPSEEMLHPAFSPEKISLAERCRGKKVILMGLPGAFTPT